MPQLPVEDDLKIFEIPESRWHEKVLTQDLAQFLGCCSQAIHKYARSRKALLWFHKRPVGVKVFYVTPYTAARVIVYIRATQGAKLLSESGRGKRRGRPRSTPIDF